MDRELVREEMDEAFQDAIRRFRPVFRASEIEASFHAVLKAEERRFVADLHEAWLEDHEDWEMREPAKK